MIYMFGELKKPLLYKKIVMPIIGPIPNIKSINFAEFLVWPNSWFFLFELALIFLALFFFIKKSYYKTALKILIGRQFSKSVLPI